MSDILGIEPDGHNYITELAKDDTPALVRIGSAEKFVPNINASKWDDEAWLNINTADAVVSAETETFADDKIALTIGAQTHRYYETPDGKLEYEIEFASRPAADIVTFNLTFSKGLRFLYQGTLREDWEYEEALNAGNPGRISWAEYQQSAGRPENVEGSYAVYHSGRDNKYRTGKFCHIYRPFLIDADGKRIWAEQNITGNQWRITMDGKWLDDAVYPVRLGPTLGYTTAGSSQWGNTGIVDAVANQVDGTGGNVDYYYCWMESVQNGSENIKIGVYEAPSSGTDFSGEALVEQVAFDASASGNNQTASVDGAALDADGWYAVAQIPIHGNDDFHYDTDAGIRAAYYTGRTYASELSNPAGNLNNAHTRKFSVWIDYSAGGAVYEETVAEIIELSDTPTATLTITVSAAEIAELTDEPSAVAILVASATDDINFADVAAAVLTMEVTAADIAELTDAATGGLLLEVTAADDVELSDTPTAEFTLGVAASDNITVDDTPGATLTMEESAGDNIELQDTPTGNITMEETAAENIELTDTPIAGLDYAAGVSEIVELTDAAAGSIILNVTAEDDITADDALSVTMEMEIAAGEDLEVQDTPTGNIEMETTVADNVTLSDGAIGGLLILVEAADDIEADDSPSANLIIGVSAEDGIGAADSPGGAYSLAAAVADGLTLSDAVAAGITFSFVVSDGIEFTDVSTAEVSGAAVVSVEVSDIINFTDSSAAIYDILATVADSVEFQDTGGLIGTFNVTTGETVEFSDVVNAALQILIATDDSIKLSDVAVGTLFLANGRVQLRVTSTKGGSVTAESKGASVTITTKQGSIDVSE